jgi:uncharacterized membrane protein YqjE
MDQVREILRAEVRLARAEVREEARQAGEAAVVGGAGILFLVFGLNFLLWALVWALAPNMPVWMASLIVAAVAVAAGAALVFAGKKKIQEIEPPTKTRQSLKENVEWAKTRMQ